MVDKADWYDTIRGQFGKDAPKSPEVLAEDRKGFVDFIGSLMATAPAGDLARLLGWDIPRRKEGVEETLMNAMFGSMGMVKMGGGFEKKLALRKVMQEEMKGRGRPPSQELVLPGKLSDPTINRAQKQYQMGLITKDEAITKGVPLRFTDQEQFLFENPWFTDVVRGSWFRGHNPGVYPKPGEVFASEKVTGGPGGKLGEPFGLSLSADAKRLEGSFAGVSKIRAKAYEKLSEKYAKLDYRLNRLLEEEKLYKVELSDAPASLMEKINKTSTQLEKIADTQERLNTPPIARVLPRFGTAPEKAVLPAWKAPETEWAQEILRDAYKEAAKKVFKDIPGFGTGLMHESTILAAMESGSGRKAFNQELSNILQKKGYKGLLYSQGRYNEAELRMLKPEDVTMLDLRTGKDKALERLYSEAPTDELGRWTSPPGRKRNQLSSWTRNTKASQAKLGHIYEDIDLRALFEK